MKRKAVLERERAEAKSVWDLLMVVFMREGARKHPPLLGPIPTTR